MTRTLIVTEEFYKLRGHKIESQSWKAEQDFDSNEWRLVLTWAKKACLRL